MKPVAPVVRMRLLAPDISILGEYILVRNGGELWIEGRL
jgi:hypothetical protein